MEEEETGKVLTSEFNEASFQILRLHNLWQEYSYKMRERNIFEVYTTLENIWIELSADANENHNKIIELYNSVIMRHERKGNIDMAIHILKKKAMNLKKLQESVGKGGKKSVIPDRMM